MSFIILGTISAQSMPAVTGSSNPVLSSIESSNLFYFKNDPAAVITQNIGVSFDLYSFLIGARVQITGNYQSTEDLLSFTDQNGITGSWDSGSGTMTLSGNSLVANYQTALRNITYSNSSNNPNTYNRIVSFTVFSLPNNSVIVKNPNNSKSSIPIVSSTYNENLFSNTVSRKISVVDPALLSSIEGSPLKYNGPFPAAAEEISNTITVDDANIVYSAIIQITGNYHSDQDVLSWTAPDTNPTLIAANSTTKNVRLKSTQNINTPSVPHASWDSESGTLTILGINSDSYYQDALRAVTYQNTNSHPNTSLRTVSFQIIGAESGDVQIVNLIAGISSVLKSKTNKVTRDIQITQPPVLDLIESNTLRYPRNFGNANLTQSTTVSYDGTNLLSASVWFTANFVSGEDVLNFTNQNGITGSYNTVSGVLSLSGESSPANYQAAIRSIKYRNTNISQNILSRSVSLQVNDGTNPSNILSRTINIINNAPVLANIESTSQVFRLGDVNKAVTSSTTIIDKDDSNMLSASIWISGNYNSNEDVLNFTFQNGIISTWYAEQGLLVLKNESAISNYQDALRSVTYQNKSGNPTLLQKTISLSVSDGLSTSNVITRNIDVTLGSQGTPTAIAATNINETGFTANWNILPQSLSYQLDVSTNSSFTSFVTGYNNLNSGNVLTQIVSGLTPGTIYYYRVRAVDSFGQSQNSNFVALTTWNQSLTPPSDIIISYANGNIFINWKNNDPNTSGYDVYRIVVDQSLPRGFKSVNDFQKIASLEGNATSFTDLNTTEGIAYSYSIVATRSDGASSGIGNAASLPEIAAFYAPSELTEIQTTNGSVTLNWIDNSTIADSCVVERSINSNSSYTQLITLSSILHTYDDLSAHNGVTYYYRVKCFKGNLYSGYSNEINTIGSITGIKNIARMPVSYELFQNYPNPFNPSTVIRYALPQESNVSLIIYNILGAEVYKLANGIQSAGFHEITFDARKLSSGFYFYSLKANTFTEIKKMILMK